MITKANPSACGGFHPLRAVIDLFDSIYLGLGLIAAILVYSTVGSAIPGARQVFELTEFQYFNHPVFVILIILFCTTLTVVTLRRIRFNMRNLGVLTVHAGLLIMCAGSLVYFGQKIEGDVWLDPPTIRVVSLDRIRSGDGNPVVDQLVARKGEVWERDMPGIGGAHRIEVVAVQHNGLRTADRVTLRVSSPNTPESTIELVSENDSAQHGHIASLSDRLALMLTPANEVDYFYDDTTPSLIVAEGSNRDEWPRFKLPQLPYYNERFVESAPAEGAPAQVTGSDGKPIASRRTMPVPLIERWRMPIKLIEAGTAYAKDWGVTLEIDGYLPYVELINQPAPGGQEVRPIARMEMRFPQASQEQWFVAGMPDQNLHEFGDGSIAEFRWIGDETSINPEWTRSVSGRHVLDIHVKDKDIRLSLDVKAGQVIPIEGTDYTLTVREIQPSWPLMTKGFEGARTAIARVIIKTPAAEFERSVLDRFPQLNQDRDMQGQKVDPTRDIVDDNIELRYVAAERDRYLLVAGQNLSPTLIYTAAGGRREMQVLKAGETFSRRPGVTLALKDLIERPTFEKVPLVVPEARRRSLMDVRRQMSAIRLHLATEDGKWSRRVWIPFSHYNTDNFLERTVPTVVTGIPRIGQLSFIYGRTTRPLPTTLALEQLETKYYPGREQASEWTSFFRYRDPETQQAREGRAHLNNTFTIGDWTFFQSQAPQDGKSWTVLGVGNRHGVMTMLAGCTLISLGMIYAFSVKPVLVRRYKAKISAGAGDSTGASGSNGSPKATEASMVRSNEPAGVPVRAILVALLSLGAVSAGCSKSDGTSAAAGTPAESLAAVQSDIDLSRLGSLAMLDKNAWRYTTVDSWARRVMMEMYGSKPLFGLDPVAAAMEIVFNRTSYDDMPILYVKDRGLLRDLAKHPIKISDEEIERMFKTKHISYDFFRREDVQNRISELSGEVMKSRAMGRMGQASRNYGELPGLLFLVPHPQGEVETPWLSFEAIMGRTWPTEERVREQFARQLKLPADPALRDAQLEPMLVRAAVRDAGITGAGEAPKLAELDAAGIKTEAAARKHLRREIIQNAASHTELRNEKLDDVLAACDAFDALRSAWLKRDAEGINTAVAALETSLPRLAPDGIYPSPTERMLELKYRRSDYTWWAWLAYIFCFFMSIFAVATRYRAAWWLATILLLGALGLHGYDLALRWQVLNRIPVANMYEAVVSSTWCGAVLALLLEAFSRNRRGIYNLAAGFLGFFALTLPILIPDKINNNLQTMMPILDDAMLRIHTVLIIASYAVITLAYVVANAYLIVTAWRTNSALARATLGAQVGALLCLTMAYRGMFEEATAERFVLSMTAALGGGALLSLGLFPMVTGSGRRASLARITGNSPEPRTGLLNEFDFAHRVLLYISSVALFVGIVLGAVWADYSWGRPWGWDPKEVFALNTWLVYAILIHVPFVSKRRALWTSVLSVCGFAAMQFNWWVVNFYIVGLHSYA